MTEKEMFKWQVMKKIDQKEISSKIPAKPILRRHIT
jgi:predicted Fe-S protein YdhL (DUF1289 family)